MNGIKCGLATLATFAFVFSLAIRYWPAPKPDSRHFAITTRGIYLIPGGQTTNKTWTAVGFPAQLGGAWVFATEDGKTVAAPVNLSVVEEIKR